MSQVNCPDCSKSVSLPDNTEVGDVLVCDSCEVELEVTNLEPTQVDHLLAQK
ncbi:MAG: lysine biosynthesis protein LysW [bacterium]|nr:lysine biosynthesis protein LysW [bacterium]